MLVICNRFTRLTQAIPFRDTTSLTVSSWFIDTWVAVYGIPDSVLIDNGPQFVSLYYQGTLESLNIARQQASWRNGRPVGVPLATEAT